MGNHPSGTFEFRFFSACDHKDKNALMFFSYLNKRLKNYNFKTRQNYIIIKRRPLKINESIKQSNGFFTINDKIESDNKELKLTYNINSKTEADTREGGEEFTGIMPFLQTYINNGFINPLATPIPSTIPSLTRSDACRGYHNDCSCGACDASYDENGGCLNLCCLNCYSDGCGNTHCDNCGNGDFCNRRDCDFCQEINLSEYNEAFNNNN